MIEQVEGLDAKFGIHALRNPGDIDRRKIEVPESWTGDSISPHVAKHVARVLENASGGDDGATVER